MGLNVKKRETIILIGIPLLGEILSYKPRISIGVIILKNTHKTLKVNSNVLDNLRKIIKRIVLRPADNGLILILGISMLRNVSVIPSAEITISVMAAPDTQHLIAGSSRPFLKWVKLTLIPMVLRIAYFV